MPRVRASAAGALLLTAGRREYSTHAASGSRPVAGALLLEVRGTAPKDVEGMDSMLASGSAARMPRASAP